MTVSWFVHFEGDDEAAAFTDAEKAALCELVARIPGLHRGHVFTPAWAGGPFRNDGPPPRLALQLDFGSVAELEAAIAPDGYLQALVTPGAWPSLAGAVVSHQAMARRAFPVPARATDAPAREPACSYLVHYPGRAEDMNAWLRHYLTQHPQRMAHLPGIRSIEIFTRIDWCDGLPWQRVRHMQRNRIAFDSPEALTVALESPALLEMRADYARFPPFVGGNVHYPMHTETVAP